jgi:hypothetical protein
MFTSEKLSELQKIIYMYQRSGEIMQRCKGRLVKLDRQLPRQQHTNNMLIKQETGT